MASTAVKQSDGDEQHHLHHQCGRISTSSPPTDSLYIASTNSSRKTKAPTSIITAGLGAMASSMASGGSRHSYERARDDDYDEELRDVPSQLGSRRSSRQRMPFGLGEVPVHRRPSHIEQVPAGRIRGESHNGQNAFATSHQPLIVPKPRSVSTSSAKIRHPMPDLQTLQGAYVANVNRLEKEAERLSTMGSSIEDSIRELREEQKRADSRRSSLLASPIDAVSPEYPRKLSTQPSILEINQAARSGGYSPGGFMMSPTGSISASGRSRTASKSSRFGTRPEPELEGRPLESFVGSSRYTASRTSSRKASIVEEGPAENESTFTRDMPEPLNIKGKQPEHEQVSSGALLQDLPPPPPVGKDRPATSASTNTFQQAQAMFENFDGVHYAGSIRSFRRDIPEEVPGQEEPRPEVSPEGVHETIPEDAPEPVPRNAERRIAYGNPLSRLSLAPGASMVRPASYADPATGQQMIYYPAPVPMMLNLPQKLSNKPRSQVLAKRRSQLLNSMPQARDPNRDSGTNWLAGVVDGEEGLAAAQGGYQDNLSQANAHLRATAFFDQRPHSQAIELKEGSAVATLDSILDASVSAPVNAFTDHLYAGHIGSEVYGRSDPRGKRSSTQLAKEIPSGKRGSTLNFLKRRRSKDMLGAGGNRKASNDRSPIDSEDEDDQYRASGEVRYAGRVPSDEREPLEDDNSEYEGQFEDEVFNGPPTTLLAELQLRKHQQKQRTKPLTKAFPNGVHATLLDMDTVAQIEARARQHKKTKLAWEAPGNGMNGDDEDDEDVPLGMLFPPKPIGGTAAANRPLGLIERRELEENEPLSQRRSRLLGLPVNTSAVQSRRASTIIGYNNTPQDQNNNEDDDDDETLAQRVACLKATNIPKSRPVSQAFSEELLSQFGDLTAADTTTKPDIKGKGREILDPPPPSSTPEEEETLGQRRRRLQAEREARSKEISTSNPNTSNNGDASARPALKPRRSLANVLQAHPAAGAGTRQSLLPLPSRPGLPTVRSSPLLDRPHLAAQNGPRHSYQLGGTSAAPPQTSPQFMGNANANASTLSLGAFARGEGARGSYQGLGGTGAGIPQSSHLGNPNASTTSLGALARGAAAASGNAATADAGNAQSAARNAGGAGLGQFGGMGGGNGNYASQQLSHQQLLAKMQELAQNFGSVGLAQNNRGFGGGRMVGNPMLANPMLANPMLANPMFANPILAGPMVAGAGRGEIERVELWRQSLRY